MMRDNAHLWYLIIMLTLMLAGSWIVIALFLIRAAGQP